MYLGKIVELTDKRSLFAQPQHPYTEALLSAVPVPDPDVQRNRIILAGDVPSPINPPPGCRFHTRCPYAFDRCRVEEPLLQEVLPAHFAACHLRDPLLPAAGRRVQEQGGIPAQGGMQAQGAMQAPGGMQQQG